MKKLAKINNILSKLKKFGIKAVKQSLEDEGSSFEDIAIMRKITKKKGLKLNVKIGGCEAKNDIFFCKDLKVDSIVAPMIESEYGLKKFIQCAGSVKKNKLLINLETALALKNLRQIVKSEYFDYLDGVVIGRSDVVGSLGLDKKDVNSKKIFSLVNKSFHYIKKKKSDNFILKMGGSVTSGSNIFISKLYENKNIGFVETRNIEFKVSHALLKNFRQAISYAFEFEIEWLKMRINSLKKNSSLRKDFKNRLQEMISRSSKH